MPQPANRPAGCACGAERTCCSSPDSVTPQVTSRLSWGDRWGHVLCRVSNRFRMSYTVKPGLYRVGNPVDSSPVFVSANYRLSFDHLRTSLAEGDSWVLVLDTKGINVWCAAGKGTFGTDELVGRIASTALASKVSHRRLIVPQLGAPGIRAHEVQSATGFRVVYGPVYARDIAGFIQADMRASAEMRRVRFTLWDRLILTPMEVFPGLRYYLAFALMVTLLFGLGPQGLVFGDAVQNGSAFLVLGLLSVVSGAFLTPVLLPWIPGRSFALKGWLVGLAGVATVHWGWRPDFLANPLGLGAAYAGFPAASSCLALNFTGCTTFTSKSGVKKELRYALWGYIGCAVVSVALLVGHRLTLLGAL